MGLLGFVKKKQRAWPKQARENENAIPLWSTCYSKLKFRSLCLDTLCILNGVWPINLPPFLSIRFQLFLGRKLNSKKPATDTFWWWIYRQIDRYFCFPNKCPTVLLRKRRSKRVAFHLICIFFQLFSHYTQMHSNFPPFSLWHLTGFLETGVASL